jgi:RNA polymerase sigma-70 factor (ECF subfamily)
MDIPAHALLDETTLLRKARWGNHAAFAELYRLHASAIHTLAYRLTSNTAAAEDITQETFLKMLQFLNGIRDDVPLRPWLKKVAANAAIDRLRKERRFSASEDESEWIAPGPAQAQEVEMSHLLRRLEPSVRVVVWLHEMEGWTHAELGTRFGQSASWSKSIVSRALERLRRELHEENQHEHA